MRPDKHIIYGFIFSLIIFIFFPSIGFFNILIIFASSTILIDTDHYLYYVYRKKDLSLKRAFFWYADSWRKFNSLTPEQKQQVYGGVYIFHGIEILVLLFFGIFLSQIFLFIFIGFLFHMFLDWSQEIKLKERTDKLFIIEDILKFRKLKHIEEI